MQSVLITIIQLLQQLMVFYSYALIIYILLSWFPNARESSFGQILGRICEPYLEPFRRIIPPLGMIDISPLVAIISLNLAVSGLTQIIRLLY
ncbi:YggT family protein [Jeotgalibacillus haloalkalitolerans]|uniref:YggT family protein n=1 Tax=Jeotgalibacillus haloalkalitolerans TaxID=3104292 RepID=A0ABU5KK80_9BACL|nr:YggT family protein [Jeotgalibacillus sp. HH7-29]MDZ5711580.1 YggT family protein [Jeotgalibacillus sp. HH7-29]